MHAFPGLAWGRSAGRWRSSGGAAGRPIALWGGCLAVRTLGLVLVPWTFRRHGVTLPRGPPALVLSIPGSCATSCGSGVSLAPPSNGLRSLPPRWSRAPVSLSPLPVPPPRFFPAASGFCTPGVVGGGAPTGPSKQPTAVGSLVVCLGTVDPAALASHAGLPPFPFFEARAVGMIHIHIHMNCWTQFL